LFPIQQQLPMPATYGLLVNGDSYELLRGEYSQAMQLKREAQQHAAQSSLLVQPYYPM